VGANLMFVAAGGGLAFLLFARWKHELVVSLLRRVTNRIFPSVTERVITVVEGFVGALNQRPDAKNTALFVLWTAVYWTVNGWGMSLFANGFDCSGAAGRECQPLVLTAFQGYFVLCVIIGGMMIPSGPASAGLFQAAVAIGLGVFFPQSVVGTVGFAYANAIWVVQLVQQVLFGLFFLVLSRSSFSDIAGRLNDQQQGKEPGSWESTG
jgi:hypothetical protein